MIDERHFNLFIESLRLYKAYMTCLLGTISEDYSFSLIQENYDSIVDGFMNATVHPQLLDYFNLHDSLDADYCAFYEFDVFESFINYGYTYTCELESAKDNPEPRISSQGILLNNVHDFYNYWVLNQLPANPVYKEVGFNSKDSEAIAKKYIAQVRKRCFPDSHFII